MSSLQTRLALEGHTLAQGSMGCLGRRCRDVLVRAETQQNGHRGPFGRWSLGNPTRHPGVCRCSKTNSCGVWSVTPQTWTFIDPAPSHTWLLVLWGFPSPRTNSRSTSNTDNPRAFNREGREAGVWGATPRETAERADHGEVCVVSSNNLEGRSNEHFNLNTNAY